MDDRTKKITATAMLSVIDYVVMTAVMLLWNYLVTPI